jgi:hypothetical protein
MSYLIAGCTAAGALGAPGPRAPGGAPGQSWAPRAGGRAAPSWAELDGCNTRSEPPNPGRFRPAAALTSAAPPGPPAQSPRRRKGSGRAGVPLEGAAAPRARAGGRGVARGWRAARRGYTSWLTPQPPSAAPPRACVSGSQAGYIRPRDSCQCLGWASRRAPQRCPPTAPAAGGMWTLGATAAI